jgi:hypothetical protein
MFPIAFHPIYQHPLPEGHRFPMLKYELLLNNYYMKGQPIQLFAPEICDLLLAIHKQVCK